MLNVPLSNSCAFPFSFLPGPQQLPISLFPEKFLKWHCSLHFYLTTLITRSWPEWNVPSCSKQALWPVSQKDPAGAPLSQPPEGSCLQLQMALFQSHPGPAVVQSHLQGEGPVLHSVQATCQRHCLQQP